eukprot:m.228848 g.228848  ORF g.228848 m.228848 type:complete len:208 (-) comp10856_c0_seq29:1120-1743(-)
MTFVECGSGGSGWGPSKDCRSKGLCFCCPKHDGSLVLWVTLIFKNSAITQREDWMLELPEQNRKNFKLGARTFRQTSAPVIREEDRAGWTAVPQGAERAAAKKTPDAIPRACPSRAQEEARKAARDSSIREKIDAYNAAVRGDSLLDLHQEKKRKKDEKEVVDGKRARRRFDREVDMGIRELDAAKKKEVLKSAGGLGSKFSQGTFL